MHLVGPDGTMRPSTTVPGKRGDGPTDTPPLANNAPAERPPVVSDGPDAERRLPNEDQESCNSAKDCPETNHGCVVAQCVDGTCGTEAKEDCCTDHEMCNDGDNCTQDSCDTDTNQCSSDPLPGCGGCTDSAQCDDDNPCTEDFCDGGSCVNPSIPSCCNVVEDCFDGNPCTEDLCLDQECKNVEQEDCCSENAQCDDGVGCTIDICAIDPATGSGTCKNEKGASCCDLLLNSGFSDPLELDAWTLDQPNTEISWQVFDKRFVSPPSCLYMGNPDKNNYINYNDSNPKKQLSSETWIRTDELNLPAEGTIELTFQVWIDIEDCKGQSIEFDLFGVYLDTVGQPPVSLMNKCDLDEPWKQWKSIKLNLDAYKGQTIRIRFDFDSVDAVNSEGEGIYIDDLEVKACY